MFGRRAASPAPTLPTQADRTVAALRVRFNREALCHIDSLYGMALRLTRDGRDAEDLVQDALLRAYEAFDRFDGRERTKPWLFKILMNTFINRYRRKALEGRASEILFREGARDIVSDATVLAAKDPEGVLQQSLLSDEVHRALSALPEEFRQAVLLCDMEEFSYKEIAEIMDCPVGTVMSRLYRGRRLLKEALQEHAEREGIVQQAERRGEVISLREAKSKRDGGEG